MHSTRLHLIFCSRTGYNNGNISSSGSGAFQVHTAVLPPAVPGFPRGGCRLRDSSASTSCEPIPHTTFHYHIILHCIVFKITCNSNMLTALFLQRTPTNTKTEGKAVWASTLCAHAALALTGNHGPEDPPCPAGHTCR